MTDHSTPAYRLGRLGAWGPVDPGVLVLDSGLLSFVSRSDGTIFSAPTADIGATVSRLLLRAGIVIRLDGRKYRLSFIPLRSAAGSTDLDGDTVLVGNEFELSDVAAARSVASDWIDRLGI